jgi:hypothetical protein
MFPCTHPLAHGSVVQQPTKFEPLEQAYLDLLVSLRYRARIIFDPSQKREDSNEAYLPFSTKRAVKIKERRVRHDECLN